MNVQYNVIEPVTPTVKPRQRLSLEAITEQDTIRNHNFYFCSFINMFVLRINSCKNGVGGYSVLKLRVYIMVS